MTIDARPLTTQATGSRLRSREACCCCCMLHVDLPGQWEGTERDRERGGRGAAWRPRFGSQSSMSSSLPLPVLIRCHCFALPCEGPGKNSTESHDSGLPSRLAVPVPLYALPSAAVATAQHVLSGQSHPIHPHHASVCFALNRRMLLLLRGNTINPLRAAPSSRD